MVASKYGNSVLGLIRTKIRERMNMLSDNMADGGIQSYDDYKYAAGMIRGLAEAEREIIDAESSYEEEDE